MDIKYLIILTVLLPTFVSAGAILSIEDVASTPEDVYAGAFGYITFGVKNTGTAIAESVNIYYTLDGVSNQLAIGDIAKESSAQVSVPFRVSNNSAGTLQVQTIYVYYQDEDSSTIKKTSLSYPITVGNLNPFRISTVDESITATAGEKITIKVKIECNENNLNNVNIKTANDSDFSIVGSNGIGVGNLVNGQTKDTELQFISDSNISPGKYNIPIVVEYQNSLSQLYQEELNVGPINIVSASQQFRVSLTPKNTAEVGDEVEFELSVENSASEPSTVTLTIGSTDQFTPIGVQTIYFDKIQPEQTQKQTISIGIAPSISSGYYSLPISLLSESGQSTEYQVGISVHATAQLKITTDSSSTTRRIQIANTGNTNIRSLYVKMKDSSAKTLSETLVGTLDVDDFDYVDIDSGATTVELSFKDNNNKEHTITNKIETTSFAFGFGSDTESDTNTNATSQMQNMRGGPAGSLSSLTNVGRGTDWFGLVLYAVGGIMIVVIAYFAYKKYYKKVAKK